MPAGSSRKRERQYEHIKESYEKRGQKGRAEEIAARTVNKERAEAGETKEARSRARPQASRGSTSGSGSSAKSSGGRSSARSGKPQARSEGRSGGERSRAELYEAAKRQGVSGRSKMNKAQLEKAVRR